MVMCRATYGSRNWKSWDQKWRQPRWLLLTPSFRFLVASLSLPYYSLSILLVRPIPILAFIANVHGLYLVCTFFLQNSCLSFGQSGRIAKAFFCFSTFRIPLAYFHFHSATPYGIYITAKGHQQYIIDNIINIHYHSISTDSVSCT